MTDNITDPGQGRQLEEALKAAVADAEARPAFYRALMEAQVYVVGRTEPGHENEDRPHLQLKQWKQPDGGLAMPFFATMESFRDMFGFSEPHLLVPVVELFRFAGGETTLVLTSPEGSKDFKKDEVEMLLSMTMNDPLVSILEKAIKADDDTAMALWNDFYSALVNSRIFVLGQPENAEKEGGRERRQLRPGENISVASWTHPSVEGPIVPFFSSQKILSQSVPSGQSYMALSAMDFLTMAASFDRPLVLNPGYEINKVFAPQEVKDILNATRRRQAAAPAPRPINPDAKFMFGRPAQAPHKLLEAMANFLQTRPEVRSAYLAVMKEEGENRPETLVAGFEPEGGIDLAPMFEAAFPVVQAAAEVGMLVDFTAVTRGEDALSHFMFNKLEPFYIRPGFVGPGPDPEAPDQIEPTPGFTRSLRRMFGAG